MKTKFSFQPMSVLTLALAAIMLLTNCSNNDDLGPYFDYSIFGLSFTDNPGDSIFVSGDEQTIDLPIRSVLIPDVAIPDNIYAKIQVWDSVKNQWDIAGWTPDTPFEDRMNVPEIYQLSTTATDGKPAIKLTLHPNTTDKARKFLITGSSTIEYNGKRPTVYGSVTVIQEPLKSESFSLKAKYKGKHIRH